MSVSVANPDERAIVFPAERPADAGSRLLATRGTADAREGTQIPVARGAEVSGGPRVVDQGEIHR